MPLAPSTRKSPAPGATPGDREQLLHLLAEAAELEHNLLCCYLYAAFSLKLSSPEHSADEAAAVERWRKVLMGIAFEEMTHLALVANLTVAIGARPHFNRPNLPVPPGYHPASIVVKLAPFSLDTLDHFIFLERPAVAKLNDGSGFECESAIKRAPPPAGMLMPGAPDYETLADFYGEIRSCLGALSAEIGEEALFCEQGRSQVGEDALRMPGLTTIDSLSKAFTAIDTIVEQGEGSPATAEDSHFSRFQEVREELVRFAAAREGFAPAWPAATNPVMRKTDLADRVHINSAPAVEVLDLANATYSLLLRFLTQIYGRAATLPRPSLEPAFKLMATLSMTGSYLATLPAGDDYPGINAGVSFTVLRAMEPFMESPDETRLLYERLGQLHVRSTQLCERHPALRKVCATLGELVEAGVPMDSATQLASSKR